MDATTYYKRIDALRRKRDRLYDAMQPAWDHYHSFTWENDPTGELQRHAWAQATDLREQEIKADRAVSRFVLKHETEALGDRGW